MEQLLQIIAKFEEANLPCRYTLSPGANSLWLAVQLSTPAGEKVFDYSLLPSADEKASEDISQKVRGLLPNATICNISNHIFIDNLK